MGFNWLNQIERKEVCYSKRLKDWVSKYNCLPYEEINDVCLKQPASYYKGMQAGRLRSNNLLRHALIFRANNNILVLELSLAAVDINRVSTVPVRVWVSHLSLKINQTDSAKKYFTTQIIFFSGISLRNFLSSLLRSSKLIHLPVLSWETCRCDSTKKWT